VEKEESSQTEAQEKKDESQIVSLSTACLHLRALANHRQLQQVNDSPRQLDHNGSLI